MFQIFINCKELLLRRRFIVFEIGCDTFGFELCLRAEWKLWKRRSERNKNWKMGIIEEIDEKSEESENEEVHLEDLQGNTSKKYQANEIKN